jgi:carbon storage regulator CsrA
MLVLTRKKLESVVVGGASEFDPVVIVKILDARPGKVKLGFEADSGVPIHRRELWGRIESSEARGGVRSCQ